MATLAQIKVPVARPSWPNSPGPTPPRLTKAKSSPNVAKMTTGVGLAVVKAVPKVDTGLNHHQNATGPIQPSGNKRQQPVKPARTAPRPAARTDHQNNNNQQQQQQQSCCAAKPKPSEATTATSGRPAAKSTSSQPSPSKQKKSVKSPSVSCTILEDRALLKKGLTSAPSKLPRKPEDGGSQKPTGSKAPLNRSASLWSVQVPSHHDGNKSRSQNKTSTSSSSTPSPSGKPSRTPGKSPLNRATSMWTVPGSASPNSSATPPGGKLLPSRIPLSTQHLGHSLGDLSLAVDRPVESSPRQETSPTTTTVTPPPRRSKTATTMVVEFPQDLVGPVTDAEPVVEVDRSVDEHIYENCNREAITKSPITSTRSSADEVDRSIVNVDLEVDAIYETVIIPGPGKTEEPKTLVEVPLTTQELEKRAERMLTELNQEAVDSAVLKKRQSNCGSRRETEMSIQEIRRNWERQIKQNDCTGNESVGTATSAITEGKILGANHRQLSRSTNSIQAALGGDSSCQRRFPNQNITNNIQHNSSVSTPKRARDIEQLVKFFNCKNSEQENSVPVLNSTPTAVTKIDTSRETGGTAVPRKLEKPSCGYSSDGNSSEDSGHISNENEVDQPEEELFLPGMMSVVGNKVGVQEAAPIPTQRSIPPQIFFRAGALERLESQRDEKLTGHIILLQARCRGYLARRKLTTLKLQDLAVRCIQRNVRKFMLVREWSWWRLYVKVAPLLNVHRTEDQLKARTEELEVLRAKVDRLEQERNHLKLDNDRLEAKLSEMTADYAEEHSTSTLAAERISAETSERLRLERELQDASEANRNLQQTAERLEMELLYARAADINGLASDAEDQDDTGGVYKQRYQHAMRELEFTKRKMAQQHEDDLEQLVGLKKQLEKKLADAYEEVEEQRQVVGQWKRRVQKLNGEMHDLRLLLEEQTARNNLLEKKQRKFDSETQNLMDDLRQERTQRERLAREKDIALAEKYAIEQNLSDARLEIELKEERLRTLSQELEELTFGGKTEEEVAQLKKAKHELEKKVKDQEEELDDLAGQVQLLEQAKLRLEMSIEQQRKEMRKEMQQRDEELEDVRGGAMKKVKALEAQLENEHEERTIVLREKHELERRLVALEEQDRTDRAAEAETTQRLKRDLKRTRALLRDAQTMLERSKCDSTGKAAMRQLKNQLEDAECARAVAVKAKQALEQELSETQAALEEASRQRSDAEDRANAANRERAELLSQLEENEEELAEVLKKYRASVQQVSAEQAQLQESQVQISTLEAEKASLKEHLAELSQRLESVEQLGDPTANSLATRRLEFRTKELESKLELEQTTRARLETQITRLKETVEKLQSETTQLRTKEQSAQDAARRLQRSLREAREEAASAAAREQEATRARRELEKSLETAEAETKVVKDDLRLALQRIDDLQSAIQGELDLDCSEEGTSENSDSE